jgi:hypothetical protein
MKTNDQLLDEITAAMADTWLAACNRRVIITTLVPTKFMVIDQQGSRLFGPASGDECQLFVHRGAARDVLNVVGNFAPEATAAAARIVMNGHAPGA